ncbi:MAG: DNA alkylation repair protein [Lactobacillales bacterium]|nr:DNA alkylation repair protein [Lactobacillales bacterium]
MNLENINWNKDNYNEFINYLFTFEDLKYKEFHSKLILNDNLIGIRTPILKEIAKKISKGDYKTFIKLNKHKFYEETIIHGLIIGYLTDFNESLSLLDNFIPYVDNWAINDIVCANMKIFKKYQKIGFNKILKYIDSNNPFQIRIGIVLLLDFYINDKYIDKIFEIVDNIHNDNYYVRMANAWALSICYIKYKEKTYNYLLNNNLDKFTFNKTISKICDSKRVDIKDKEKLKKIRR